MKSILMKITTYFNKMQPTQIMVLGFAMVILIGAIILNLPMSTKSGESIGFLNALFTSTSAVCVTGLVVVDTATYWNTFGQIVILLLVQIGGLGFMTVTTMFALIIRKRIYLRERILIQEALNEEDLSGLVKLTRYVIMMTFIIEGIGALLLSTVFIPQFGLGKGIWYSIFHSITAFCNAGFDLMGSVTGPFSSLTSYVNNFTVSMTISILIILGGIGFPVILDVIKNKKFSRLNLHSKIVLFTTSMLILIGTILIFLAEFNNVKTLGNLNFDGKLIASIFQSITPRTAGFNTIDLTLMNESSILIIMILMFIGASPASTGGGIKTTALATLMLTTKGFIFNREYVEIYGRRIKEYAIRKSLSIFIIAISLFVIGTLFISLTEAGFTLLEAGFEVVSALATVGLSIGGTPTLSSIGKVIIIILMFTGRVGSLTIFMALSYKGAKKKPQIKYPEGKIIIG